MAASLQEYYNTGEDAGGTSTANGITWSSQGFLAASSYNISSVKLKLYRTGSPGTVNVYIRAADSNYLPTGSNLASGTTNGNTLTTSGSGEWREITFGSPYGLISGNKYAIVVDSTTFTTAWLGDSDDNYANGVAGTSILDGAWSKDSNTEDFMFENWGEAALPTKATNPTPSDAATDTTLDQATVTWEDGGGATSYNVYYGTESGNLSLVSEGQAGVSFTVTGITNGSPYDYLITRYWRIDSINDAGTTTGDEWSFTTIRITPPTPTYWYSTNNSYYRLLVQDDGTYGDHPPTGVENTDYVVLAAGYVPNAIRTARRLVCVANSKVWYEDI